MPFINGCRVITISNLIDGILTPSDQSTGTTTGRQALRTASHNILYTIANSDAQNISKDSFPTWTMIFVATDVIMLIFTYVAMFGGKRKKEVIIIEE